MASFEFNPIANFVVLRFKCPECGHDNETDALYVPVPDFTAENHGDSCNSEDYEHECPNCGHLFEITLNNGMYGGDGEITDVEDGLSVEEEFPDNEDDYEEYKSTFFDEHVKDTIEVLDKIDVLDERSRKLLYRTLYANVISSMEAYLSDRLIQKVMSSEETKRKFVEGFKDYKDEKIVVSDVFKHLENLDSRIIKTLREIIYHNLPRVKNIYNSVLGINLGEKIVISDLMKCIGIRHDIVHRNGKDKDKDKDKEGNLQDISKEDVLELAEKVSKFIGSIEYEFLLQGINPDESEIELPFE